jgi:hypothetical protein
MDPIQPIERRSPWISELAAEQTQGVSRERRKTPRDANRKSEPRRPTSDRSSRGDQEPKGDGPEGRHIDVHA